MLITGPASHMVRVFGAVVLAVAGLSLVIPASARAFDDFDRLQTVEAAKKFYDTAPLPFLLSNCTFFVSQALWDGGLPSTADWTPNSSDPSKLATDLLNPGPTKPAADADYFKNYMRNSGRATITEIKWSDNTAGGAQLADVIGYDWDKASGGKGSDGVIDHLAIVTGFTSDHYPLVTQHTPSRLDRGWSWDPDNNNWIEKTNPGSRAYLIHFH
jgi:Putative amidase domain